MEMDASEWPIGEMTGKTVVRLVAFGRTRSMSASVGLRTLPSTSSTRWITEPAVAWTVRSRSESWRRYGPESPYWIFRRVSR